MRYFGKELQHRMKLLGISKEELATATFMEKAEIQDMLDNKTAYEEVEEFDMALICNVLHCDEQYFIDEKVRNKDLLVSTMNRGRDTKKSNSVKAQIQDFMNDYKFISDIFNESLQGGI